LPENERAAVLDAPKKAAPVGTVAGRQFAAVLKSPEAGLVSQVVSCAAAGGAAANSAANASTHAAPPLPPAANAIWGTLFKLNVALAKSALRLPAFEGLKFMTCPKAFEYLKRRRFCHHCLCQPKRRKALPTTNPSDSRSEPMQWHAEPIPAFAGGAAATA
jgi:hypothetical protein